MRDALRPALLLIAVFLLQWIGAAARNYPSWDGGFYYAYARSPVLDGDLHLANDLVLSYPLHAPAYAERGIDKALTPTGHVQNTFPPGAALFWLPWLAAASFGARLLGGAPTGYEWYFLQPTAGLTAVGGLLVFWMAWQLARRHTDAGSALAATLTLMVATPLVYYQFSEPYYAHVASALTAAWATLYWLRCREALDDAPRALALGGLIGLTALVRWQNAVYLLLPLAGGLWRMGAQPLSWGALRGWLRQNALVGLGAAAVFSVQLTVWRITFGDWLLIPQGAGFLAGWPHWLGPLLFSPFRGLLAWMPVYFPAVAGLVVLARRRPTVFGPLLVLCVVDLLVNAATRDWFGGGGYGPRRFTTGLIWLVLGYAGFLSALPAVWRRWVAPTAGVLLFWHQWTLLRYGLSERLGGFVTEMAPGFLWQEETWGVFARRLGEYMASAVWQPAEFWLLPRAPLAELIAGRLPWQAALGLLAGALVWALYLAAARRIGRALHTPDRLWGLLVGIAVGVAAVNGWVWWWG